MHNITLYPFQIDAVKAIVAARHGIVKAPAGAGKTIIAAAALDEWVQQYCAKILWLANTREQIEQGKAAIARFPHIVASNIDFSCYAGDPPLGDPYGLVICDEVHHIAAPVFRKWLTHHTGHKWGFSATPDRGDDLTDDVYNLIGPIVYEVARGPLVKAGILSHAKVEFFCPNESDDMMELIETDTETRFKSMERSLPYLVAQQDKMPLSEVMRMQSKEAKLEAIRMAESFGLDFESPIWKLRVRVAPQGPNISHIRAWLMQAAQQELRSRARWQAALKYGVYENPKRNAKIIERAMIGDETTLILIGKIAHGEQLSKSVPGSIVVHSRMKGRAEAFAGLRDGSIKTAFVTSLLDEGADIPRASRIILAAAGRSSRQQEQRTGRVLRTFAEKTHGKIEDMWDCQHPMLLRQSRARAKTYAQLGYEFAGTQSVVEKVLHAIGITINKAIGFKK